MDFQTSGRYFYTLSCFAVLALWGVSLWNGTVTALIFAAWHGKLGEGGLPLKTVYTGVPLIDYPIAVLVAFFFYGTNGHDDGYQLFLLDAYSTLQPAFVWLYVEASRPWGEPKWISRPVVFGLLWQCFGAAISLPLYYGTHLQWISQTRADVARAADISQAIAIPFAFLFGAVAPMVIGMAPTWFGPYSRPATTHQMILAAWQPDPIWVSWITLIAATIVASLPQSRKSRTRPNRDGDEDKRRAHRWICASYLLAAASSVLGHLYVMGRIATSDSQAMDVVRMYVPFLFTGPSETTDILVRGPWLFLQYDFIIISLSSLSWAFLLLKSTYPKGHVSTAALALVMMVSSVVIGPGATVSITLFLRERHLPDQSSVPHKM
ncbi:hypothetical protein F4677DRAFT_339025 [Hypoxylon crocopeplum]|nr:hypothetical protein F4677DRAFT_339025 [Hypoxylon crocopeplum]